VPDVDLLVAVTYYAPYVSGLTNVARDVAAGLAARGHRVRVVTSRHDPALPRREVLDGVEVQRVPVLARWGKGVLSPGYVPAVRRAARLARLTNLHLPMPEAGAVALRLPGPAVVTYHCDVSLPPGPLNRAVGAVIDLSSRTALRRADRVVVTSQDYAEHSRVWSAMAGRTTVIPPPCHARPAGRPRFRDGAGLHVGFLGRIVEEKGLPYLVQAFQALGDPAARLLVAGDFTDVAGGSVVDDVRRMAGGDERIRFLGFLPDADLADLYASLDVFALPSVNSFEAFGIVQVEAMMAGVPVLASDLPGVRTPVRETGFGMVTAPRDVAALTAGLARLRESGLDRVAGARRARERYALETVLDAYEELLSGTGSAR
jgi:glycosyltransferase involved in cell wall biosynthesis